MVDSTAQHSTVQPPNSRTLCHILYPSPTILLTETLYTARHIEVNFTLANCNPITPTNCSPQPRSHSLTYSTAYPPPSVLSKGTPL